jgi:hypothetical protein
MTTQCSWIEIQNQMDRQLRDVTNYAGLSSRENSIRPLKLTPTMAPVQHGNDGIGGSRKGSDSTGKGSDSTGTLTVVEPPTPSTVRAVSPTTIPLLACKKIPTLPPFRFLCLWAGLVRERLIRPLREYDVAGERVVRWVSIYVNSHHL